MERLLRPRSIAVVGGGTWCENVIAQVQKAGFDGTLWSVHPIRETVAGVPCVPSVSDLPAAPDAVYVGVNRYATVDVVRALARIGAGGAVCFASGFREAEAETGDGADLQDALLMAAGGMPILGPNCYGLLNMLDGVALWPDEHGAVRTPTGVAIITQSSNIAINLTMQRRALQIAYVVTAGNQAQLGLSDIAMALLEDPRVTAIGLHIEGIDDVRRFEHLARAARAKSKPIVTLKVGRSVQAQAATVTHTASLAGSSAGWDALCARLGVGQARTLSGFLEALKVLHVVGPLGRFEIAAASCSGGEAGLIADAVCGTALTFPSLNDKQIAGLHDALGPKVALSNPLDYHTYIWGDEDASVATFAALMNGAVSMGCVVLDLPRSDRCDPSAWHTVLPAVASAQATSGKPIAVLSSLADTMPEDLAQQLVSEGIVPLCGLHEGVEAMDVAAQIGTATPSADPILIPKPATPKDALSEAEAKAALADYGVTVPTSVRVTTPEDAARAAASMDGAVAVKGEGIAHKTEAGAVVLGLTRPAEVEAAARAMPCDTFIVEAMVTGTVAELLVGVTRDPAHGYVLTLGAGGQWTEVLDDTAHILLSTDRSVIETALRSLRMWPLLEGYRGRPAADITAIVDTVLAVQDFVAETQPIALEINPLMCGPDGAIAADALIIPGEPT